MVDEFKKKILLVENAIKDENGIGDEFFKHVSRWVEQLPVFKMKNKIMATIQKGKVTILTGETGSGKTTQVPQFLSESIPEGKIVICTQPTPLGAREASKHVSCEFDEHKADLVMCLIGYVTAEIKQALVNKPPKILYCSEFALIDLLSDPNLDFFQYCGAIMLDEAHVRSNNTDILLEILKNKSKPYDVKIIISSATLRSSIFRKYFETDHEVNEIHVRGRKYKVELEHRDSNLLHVSSTFSDLFSCVSEELKDIYTREPGDILVFLPDAHTAKVVYLKAKRESEQLGEKIFFALLTEYSSTQQYDEALEKRPIGYSRKVIFSNSYAETSVTIPGVVYVVDSGLAEKRTYNPTTQSVESKRSTITKASAVQRKGRAGRTRDGICIRLYPRNFSFSEESPEITRTCLDLLCLVLLRIGVPNVYDFDFIQPPTDESLRASVNVLTDFGLIESDEKCQSLTSAGTFCSNFDLNPLQSKLFIEADKEKCLKLVCYLLAVMKQSYLFSNSGEQLDQKLWAIGDHMVRLKMLIIYLSEKCNPDCENLECNLCFRRRVDHFERFSGPITDKTVKALRNAVDTATAYYNIAKDLRNIYTDTEFLDESPEEEQALKAAYLEGELEEFSETIDELWLKLGPILCKGMSQFIVSARGRTKDISDEMDSYALYGLPEAHYQQNNLISSERPVNVKIDPSSVIFTNNWKMMPYFLLINTSETIPGARFGVMASPITPNSVIQALPERYHQKSDHFLQSNLESFRYENIGPGLWNALQVRDLGIKIEKRNDAMISWNDATNTIICTCLNGTEAVRRQMDEELKDTEEEMVSKTLEVDIGVRRMVIGAGCKVESLPQANQSRQIEIANLPTGLYYGQVRRFVNGFFKENKVPNSDRGATWAYKKYEAFRSFNVQNHRSLDNTLSTWEVTLRTAELAEALMGLNRKEVCTTHGLKCDKKNDSKCAFVPLWLTRRNFKVKTNRNGLKLMMMCQEQIHRASLYSFLGMLKASSISMRQESDKSTFQCSMTFTNAEDVRSCKKIFRDTVHFSNPVPDLSDTVKIPPSQDLDEKNNLVEGNRIFEVLEKVLVTLCTDLMNKYPNSNIQISPAQIHITSKAHQVPIRCALLKVLAPYSIYLNPQFVTYLKEQGLNKEIEEESKGSVYILAEKSRAYVRIYGAQKTEVAQKLKNEENEYLKTHRTMRIPLPDSHARNRVNNELEKIKKNLLWKDLAKVVHVQYLPMMNVVELTGLKDHAEKAHSILKTAFEHLVSEEVENKEQFSATVCPCCLGENLELIPLQTCGTAYCSPCWAKWFQLQASNNKPLRCPVDGCGKLVLVDELNKNLLGIDPASFLLKAYVSYVNERPRLYRMCNTEGCMNFFYLTKEQGTGDCSFKRYCFYCEKFSEYESKTDLKFLSDNYSQCPKCWAPVERIDGCNHMTCKCRFEYCYVCEKKWSLHSASSTCHYKPYSKKNQTPLKVPEVR